MNDKPSLAYGAACITGKPEFRMVTDREGEMPLRLFGTAEQVIRYVCRGHRTDPRELRAGMKSLCR